MNIRTANYLDIDGLKFLNKELDSDAVLYQPEHFVMSDRTDDYFINLIDNEHTDILIAEENDELLGFALLYIQKSKNISCLKPQSNLYIGDLCVTKKKRNCGVGTKLINACKAYGKKQGLDFIRLQVFPLNQDGIRFYERNGFKEMMKTLECEFS
ncbi:MAG: GCN5-related N-acetyltransferase [Anaerocolumna sp.]|jgi:ribosomal protein S18 acetylase RimI-like enzyme|nr:GCN5-related N-acetyltransferase [Anaerocolumna sp.]